MDLAHQHQIPIDHLGFAPPTGALIPPTFSEPLTKIIDPDTLAPTTCPKRASNVLGSFWGGIFSSPPPSDEEALHSLCSDYKRDLLQGTGVDNRVLADGFNHKIMQEIVTHPASSSAGPDGILQDYF
jgi:hypothetical protein